MLPVCNYHSFYFVSIVNEAVNPTLKFLGSFSTPKIALECFPLPSNTFTNKSEAPLTTIGESSQSVPDWKYASIWLSPTILSNPIFFVH